MGLEMAIIFAFQIMYGYIYMAIGAIITSFLFGLLPGAMVGKKWKAGNSIKMGTVGGGSPDPAGVLFQLVLLVQDAASPGMVSHVLFCVLVLLRLSVSRGRKT